jgi:hypothetical protein
MVSNLTVTYNWRQASGFHQRAVKYDRYEELNRDEQND